MVRFPRVSNATDVDALAAEPGDDVRVTDDPDVVARADPSAPGFAAMRESMLDRLADAIDEHLDTAALTALIGIDL